MSGTLRHTFITHMQNKDQYKNLLWSSCQNYTFHIYKWTFIQQN